VVTGLDGSAYCTVALPSGESLIPLDDVALSAGDALAALIDGTLAESGQFLLRLQSLLLLHAYQFDPRSGLSNARVEPQLHQIYIAHRVANKLRPRMILADEVGLGKTIEAGLIIKELIARRLLDRILIVCPASIQLQWQQELKRKFNEDFRLLDGQAVKYLGRNGTNPWAAEDRVICSLNFAARPTNAEHIKEAGWDMIVFDEAHKVRRTWQGPGKYKTTLAYDLAADLKDTAYGALLLTATPMQLHPFELYSLLELVEPGLYGSYSQYEERRRDLPQLNALMKLLQSWETLLPSEREEQLEQHRPLLVELGFFSATSDNLDNQAGREAVVDSLVQRHPMAECLVRNRKAEIGGFTKREAHRVEVRLTDREAELYADVTRYTRDGYRWAQENKNAMVGFLMVSYQKMFTSSSQALRRSLSRRVDKLRGEKGATGRVRGSEVARSSLDLEDPGEISELTALIEDSPWQSINTELAFLTDLIERLGDVRDSKADVLVNKIVDPLFHEQPTEKLLIFTQFIETQEYLSLLLRRFGYDVATFNGKMSLDEKEAAIYRFKQNVPILISTEAGGEGRNLQFCHRMVNYDLPWNPMRVEQRIGRLDRIGQTRPVVIYNLACIGTIEERVLEVLDTRIRLFEESVGSLDPILGEVEKQLENLLRGDDANRAFDRWELDLEHRVLRARDSERTMQDFILDHASLRRDEANDLLHKLPFADHGDLARYVAQALEYHGGSMHPHVDGGIEIALSPRLATELGVQTSIQRGVFDPQDARSFEQLDFFAFGHPLIEKLIHLDAGAQPLAGAYRGDDLDVPVTLEVYYEIRGDGVRAYSTLVRHRVDERLTVGSEHLALMPKLGKAVHDVEVPSWLGAAAAASRREAHQELESARQRMQGADTSVRDQELARANRIADYRRDRLRAQLNQQQTLVHEKESSGSERDQRILPALRGKVEKLREALERVGFERDREVVAITERRLGISLRVLAAGIVVR
jgi:superfamily II DNA or RNA helicase